MTNPSASATASSKFDFATLASVCAAAAAATVIGMFATFVLTGIGQDPLQSFQLPGEYAATLLRNPPVLKLAIGLDNGFVLFYSTMFLALGVVLSRERARRPLAIASIALLGATGALDLAENMHFLSMLAAAERGVAIGVGEIGFQYWETLTKFHLSYLGLFLFGYALPRTSQKDKLLAFLCRWVQWPVGLAVHLAPATVAAPLVLVRFSIFFAAALLVAANYRRGADGSDEPA